MFDCTLITIPTPGEEQVIMEGISDNDIVVIVGATGSGKTTQVIYQTTVSLVSITNSSLPKYQLVHLTYIIILIISRIRSKFSSSH